MPAQRYRFQQGKVHHVIIGLICLIAVLLLMYSSRTGHQEVSGEQALPVMDLLGGGDTTGYDRVFNPREFTFPLDHGPHPGYRHEWWYFTGNLHTRSGRHFGFQLTFFRFALRPHERQRDSQWATTQMMMAHFALSDVDEHRFYQYEKSSRVALGLAGATAQPFKVWVDNWSATGAQDDTWPVTLHAIQDDIEIDLTLTPTKPVVLQGEKGLSRKGANAGNASYYYSYTHLQSRGVIRTGTHQFEVSGLSWLDREWGTSSLTENQSGWDWFALQLSDGSEVMVYRLRRRDGSVDPYSSGIMISRDGDTHPLQAQAFHVQILSRWRSPHTQIIYPSRWHLAIPEAALDVEIEPLLQDQELHTSINYWEGAVRIHGTRHDNNVSGYGYVELTGYGQGGGRKDQ